MTIYASKKNILELESDVYKSNFSYCCVWLTYRPLLFNYVLTVDRGTVDKEQKGHITSKNGRPNRQTNVATGIYCNGEAASQTMKYLNRPADSMLSLI